MQQKLVPQCSAYISENEVKIQQKKSVKIQQKYKENTVQDIVKSSAHWIEVQLQWRGFPL